jgi:hypothetical protein
MRWPGLRVHQNGEECKAEEFSTREDAICHRPTTLCGVGDSGLLDMPRGCSARAPKGVPEQ